MFGPQVSIIFVPTFNCNCNCAYCFEPRSHESISLEDLSTVFSRVSSYLAGSGVRQVDVLAGRRSYGSLSRVVFGSRPLDKIIDVESQSES